MPSRPRTPGERRRDTELRLACDIDVWVATAGTEPYLVPLSFDWDGRTVLLATDARTPTGRNLSRSGRVRLALGPTRDVSMIDGAAEQLAMDGIPAAEADRFAARAGFDPRRAGPTYRWYRVLPDRIQAWREVGEMAGRELMRDGKWLTPRTFPSTTTMENR